MTAKSKTSKTAAAKNAQYSKPSPGKKVAKAVQKKVTTKPVAKEAVKKTEVTKPAPVAKKVTSIKPATLSEKHMVLKAEDTSKKRMFEKSVSAAKKIVSTRIDPKVKPQLAGELKEQVKAMNKTTVQVEAKAAVEPKATSKTIKFSDVVKSIADKAVDVNKKPMFPGLDGIFV